MENGEKVKRLKRANHESGNPRAIGPHGFVSPYTCTQSSTDQSLDDSGVEDITCAISGKIPHGILYSTTVFASDRVVKWWSKYERLPRRQNLWRDEYSGTGMRKIP